MKYPIVLFYVFLLACNPYKVDIELEKGRINSTLDDWHDAAEDADFDRYFGHFADSTSVFIGTDATERWTRTDFEAFAKPHFEWGASWNFTPIERYVYISEYGKTAWFDEKLDTPNLGPSRGSGVLVLKNNEWKIAHYNLSVPIPNPLMNQVKDAIELFFEEMEKQADK